MRLFPKEWEGTSPLLPRTPEILPTSQTPALCATFGCLLGVTFGMGRWAYTRVLFRKFYQQHPPQPKAVFTAIGASTAVSAVMYGQNEFMTRQLQRAEAYNILNQAGIPIPSPSLWERTKLFTPDDAMVAAGVFNAISVLFLQKLRPSGWASLGQISLSVVFAYNALAIINNKQGTEAHEQHKLELAAAAKSYEAQFGKPAPLVLYGMRSVRPWKFSVVPPSERSLEGDQALNFPESATVNFPESATVNFPESATVMPQPSGSQPHNCVLFNGSLVYGTTRDYLWEPEDAESGIKRLKEHVKELTEKRAKLVQEAAFLFQEVAQRENKYLTLSKEEHDTEMGRKSRKAMELLSSMHSNTYTEIAELDWLISDSKKMILQLETDGTWMPKSPGPPAPQITEAILDKIRQHQKKTELMLQQLDYLAVPTEAQPQLEDDKREVKENAEATTDLVEYFEELSKPR
jgi:hypothetical protein